MSASRKRPTPSPPVQAQGPPQARTPQAYPYQQNSEWAGGRGHQEDQSRQAQQPQNYIYSPHPQQHPPPQPTWESYQNYAQSGTTHEQLNQQAQVPGPNPASGVQNNMYAQRPNTQFIPNQAYMNRQPNIRASQPRQNMNIAASPNQNMYSMPNTTTMFINPNQQVYGTHPGQVIVQTATGSQVFRQPLPQYSMTSSQGQYTAMQPNPAYYQPQTQQNNPTMYFSQPSIPVAQTRQLPQTGMQAPAPPAPTKRERKRIPIIDPTTGKDINEEISQNSTPPASGSSSARATPAPNTNTPPPPTPQTTSGAAPPITAPPAQPSPPMHGNEIAAQFAAQVAASLNQTNSNKSTPPEPSAPPTNKTDSSKTHTVVNPPEQVDGAAPQPQPTKEAESSAADVSGSESAAAPVESAPVKREASPATTTPVNSAPVKSEDAQTVRDVKSNSGNVDDGEKEKANPEPQPVEEQAVTTDAVSTESAKPVSSVKEEAEDSKSETTSVSAQSDTIKEASVKAEVNSVQTEARTNSVSTPEGDSEADSKTKAKATTKEEPVKEAPSSVKEQAAEEENSEARDRKKGKKQKLKELNEKGESKEGSDMDAFTDKPAVPQIKIDEEIQESRPVQEAPTPEAPVTSDPEPQSNADTPAQPEIRKVEIQVNDSVAEKNEKNEEKSKEDSDKVQDPVIKKDKIELKYKYREDQWSPLNPEGKKHYDRNFLLNLQFIKKSTTKPDNLPKLPDVILDKPLTKREYSDKGPMTMNSGRSLFDFTPGFVKTASPRPSMGKRNSQQRDKPPKKIITLSMQREDITLHHSENAWKPAAKAKDATDADTSKTQELYRKTTSILNKLTPQKFQTLLTQILQLEIDSEERLKGVIDLIFEKALSEPGFSVAYANMCKCMMQIKVKAGEKPGENVMFRPLLLNRCQREFEKDKVAEADFVEIQKDIDAAPEEKKAEMKAELELLVTKARRRNLGNIRFIGELFKLKMLTETIMHDCLFKLLRANDEESLECLCRLLTTIGKDIDHEKAKPRVDQYFNQMEKIIKQRKTSSRVRFMLQDVAELRRSKWVPRRQDNNPKTIDQIHKEVAKEDQERDILLHQLSMQKNSQPKKPARDHRGGGPQGMQQSDDGWQSVGAKPQRAAIDPSKMKISQRNVDDNNIQLGPGGRGFGSSKWVRGSSGGAKQNQEAERTPTPANRFSALSSNSERDRDDSRGRVLGRGATPSRGGGDRKGSTPQLSGRLSGQKSFSRPSQEQERESALAAVRNMGRSNSSTRGPGSNAGSRESSRTRDMSRESREKQAPASVELTYDEFEKKTKAIMDEFLQIQDSKEAILCVKELQSPKNIHMFVTSAMNQVLERSMQARQQCGGLLRDLVKQEVITEKSYVKGLQDVLEFAEDMEIDIPKIWQYLGELMAPMIHEAGISMAYLKTACEPLLLNNKAGHLVSCILHEASNRMGHTQTGELWHKADLEWSDFLPSSENVQEFIKKNKLEFTVSSSESKSREPKTLSMEKISVKLDELIGKNSSNEEVFDWIEDNVGEPKVKDPAFIRALMTSVCHSAVVGSKTSSKMEQPKITKRTNLLRKYLDHQADFELQALYALQALVHKLDHPAGLLRSFFDTLYDEDVISEDAFNQWETSTDPAEQLGKGVAKNSVVQFFTWLREAEEEESQDDN